MKRFNKLVAIILAVGLISSIGIPAYAKTTTPSNDIENTYNIESNEFKTEKIKVFGEYENLYIEFKDSDEAINKINNAYPDLISKISKTYNVDGLTDNSWEEFKNAFFKYVIDYNLLEASDEFHAMVEFFDIYENKSKNNEIKELIKSNKTFSTMSLITDFSGQLTESQQKLAQMLPFTSKLSEKYNNVHSEKNKLNVSVMSASDTLNKEKAIEYAANHAESINLLKYYYFKDGDCANFASQILEAAGVKQTVYDQVSKGWWHTFKIVHKHSQAWSMADTFARYMGISHKTVKDHNSFSKKLIKGDFITVDFTSDGDWDHIGFVTARNLYPNEGYKYIDYKVAQHTGNYHQWTSGPKNGWETYTKGTYAVVRR